MKTIPYVLGVILLDQFSKFLVLRFYPNLVSLNDGGAFSFLNGFSFYTFIVAFLIVMILCGLILVKQTRVLGVFLILAGAFSNLIDRLFRTAVVDFINIKIWPSFNIADIAISVGLVLIIVYLFTPIKKSP